MEAITFVNVICVLLLYAGLKAGVKRSLLPAVALILICFLGVRYNYGNDFKAYEDMFAFINSNSDVTVRKYRLGLEYGWIYFNRLLAPFGFQTLVFIHTAIQIGTAAWFIIKYADLKYQWAIMAIYLFWPALMLIQLSMMRQTLAMCIVLWGIPFLFKNKYLIFCIFPIIAAQFHTSGYIGLLFPIVYFFRNIDYKKAIIIFVVIFLTFLFAPSSALSVVNVMLDNKEFGKYNYYTATAGNDAMRSGLGFIYQIVLSVYMLFILRWKSANKRFFILSLAVYYLSTPLTATLGSINRLFMFFLFPGIISFQPLFMRTRRDVMAFAMVMVFVFYILSSYTFFFQDPIYTRAFSHYHTIFG